MAILTAPGVEGEIVKALVFLGENPAWRTRLGANARTEALAKYTWRHHVDAILTRLQELASVDEGVARAS